MSATLISKIQNNSTAVKQNRQAYWNSLKDSSDTKSQTKQPIPFSFSNLPYGTADVEFLVYSNSIVFKNFTKSRENFALPLRKDNDISKFSVNSRRRLLTLLSKINLSKYSIPVFATFTFHNLYPDNSQKLKNLIDKFLKSIKRIDENIAYVYRLEWQKRNAPHFHFMFFFPTYYDANKIESLTKKIKLYWFSYLEDHDYYTYKYSVDFVKVNDKRKVFSYISKYTCKIENESEFSYIGRRWGCSKNLNFSSLARAVCDVKFMNHLKRTFWKYISKKFRNISELEKCFFDTGKVTIKLYLDEIEMLIKESVLTFESS